VDEDFEDSVAIIGYMFSFTKYELENLIVSEVTYWHKKALKLLKHLGSK